MNIKCPICYKILFNSNKITKPSIFKIFLHKTNWRHIDSVILGCYDHPNHAWIIADYDLQSNCWMTPSYFIRSQNILFVGYFTRNSLTIKRYDDLFNENIIKLNFKEFIDTITTFL